MFVLLSTLLSKALTPASCYRMCSLVCIRLKINKTQSLNMQYYFQKNVQKLVLKLKHY